MPGSEQEKERPTNTSPSPIKAQRYQSLDIWRGMACLSIVVFHAAMQVIDTRQSLPPDTAFHVSGLVMAVVARLWIGVPVFFVISGYCIMATLESQRRKSASLASYFGRRVWRIYPPYLVALGISILGIWCIEHSMSPGLLSDGIFTIPRIDQLSASQWFGNLTISESWRHLVGGGDTQYVLPITWTLCYEEQFYLLAGLLLFFAPNRIYLAAGVLTVVSVAVKATASLTKVNIEGFAFDGRWLLFAAGVLAYYGIHHATHNQRRWIYAVLAFGMLLADTNPWELLAGERNHGIERFVACGFGMVIMFLHRWDAAICRIKALRPIAACGTMCYSIYLAHPLVTKGIGNGLFHAGYNGEWETLLLTIPLCLVVSIACAVVFYRCVEIHFVTLPRKPVKLFIGLRPGLTRVKELLATGRARRLMQLVSES